MCRIKTRCKVACPTYLHYIYILGDQYHVELLSVLNTFAACSLSQMVIGDYIVFQIDDYLKGPSLFNLSYALSEWVSLFSLLYALSNTLFVVQSVTFLVQREIYTVQSVICPMA